MRTFRIAVIPGDGIGKEVTPEGIKVLEAIAASSNGSVDFTCESFPWGCEYYHQTGRMMPEDGLSLLESFDAIYFGAVGWPDVPDHVSLWGLRLEICQGFDQYVCLRPVTLLPGVQSPLRDASRERIDFVVVRENTEGEYAGVGGRTGRNRGKGAEAATQTAVFTEAGCERIIRYAFDLAMTRPRRKVTSVTKSNAQQFGMTLWDDVFHAVAAEYPGVETEQWLVDAMAARFVLRPETLDVVVASNLFGDILSDLGSAIAGSLGIAASANIDPLRRKPSMFEPVHGSAPDIAGKGIANPIGAIGSASLMLDHLGLGADADRIRAGIAKTTASGILTPDLGGIANTTEVGDAIASALAP